MIYESGLFVDKQPREVTLLGFVSSTELGREYGCYIVPMPLGMY